MQKLSRTLLPDGYLEVNRQSTPGVATLSSSDVEDILSHRTVCAGGRQCDAPALTPGRMVVDTAMRSEKFYFV